MIFRRSLVRELTATAVGLFLVLLAILFTNLVLRLLARAAGGTVAPEGMLALLGFNALFYFNILLSVTRLRDRAAHADALVPRQRDDRLVHLRPGAHRLPAADPARSPRRSSSRSSCCRSTFRRGPSSASSSTSASSSRATKSRCITPGLFREFRRANLVVFVESINTFDGTIRNVFLHSVEDGKDVTTVARSGMLQEAPNGDRFIVLNDGRRYEGKPGDGRLPRRRVRLARAPDRARGTACAADVDQGDSDRDAHR